MTQSWSGHERKMLEVKAMSKMIEKMEVEKLLDELDRHVKAAKAEDVKNEMTQINLGHHMLAFHYAARASAWETMRRLLETMRAFYSETKRLQSEPRSVEERLERSQGGTPGGDE